MMMVIGLGNDFRRDDAIGLIAVRRVRQMGIVAKEHDGDLATLIDLWKSADGVILVDAVMSGALPGTIHRLDVSMLSLHRELFKNSTHAFGLADAVELARTLGKLPACVYLFGVEVRDVSAGIGLTFEVESALPALLQEIVFIAISRFKAVRECNRTCA